MEVEAAIRFIQDRSVRSFQEHETRDQKVAPAANPCTATLDSIFDITDTSGVYLAGHSFGACSTVHVSQQEHLKAKIHGVLLLDLWPFPLSQEQVLRTLLQQQQYSPPAYSSLPPPNLRLLTCRSIHHQSCI
jgi:hypothetical protein